MLGHVDALTAHLAVDRGHFSVKCQRRFVAEPHLVAPVSQNYDAFLHVIQHPVIADADDLGVDDNQADPRDHDVNEEDVEELPDTAGDDLGVYFRCQFLIVEETVRGQLHQLHS